LTLLLFVVFTVGATVTTGLLEISPLVFVRNSDPLAEIRSHFFPVLHECWVFLDFFLLTEWLFGGDFQLRMLWLNFEKGVFMVPSFFTRLTEVKIRNN